MSSTPVTKRAFPRAGLLGNPSDGYGGKTISFTFSDFEASVTLVPSERLEICAPSQNEFDSIDQLDQHVANHGYYGAGRILKAAVRQFLWYTRVTEQELHDRNFRLEWTSNIPRQVGLAGSSAIITATLEALFAWYDVTIPLHLRPALTLSVETELGIAAGYQDRVIQAYRGLVYMDFASEQMNIENELGFGYYERLPVANLDRVFVSFAATAGEPTEVFHNNLAQRFSGGEQAVVNAMNSFAEFAAVGREAILNSDMHTLSHLIDQNFDQRQSICQLPAAHVRMIEAARSAGCSAKFCGSGGAIVGIYPNPHAFQQAEIALKKQNCVTIQPTIAE